MKALDLFAGAGGWDLGARDLGIDPLGIELDPSACATRKAAGFPTLEADIAALDPLDFAPCDLLIASPPCQAWSMAGNRKGQEDIERVYALTAEIAKGKEAGRALRMAKYGAWLDDRSRLVTEPLRWTLALKPRSVTFEQVPPVLDYWKHVAGILRDQGYSTWVGLLSSERFGVPQTRKRAILMASLDGPVEPPRPTHQAYVSGEPARHEYTLEGEILPWVSMADALGWTESAKVVAGDRVQAGGGNVPRSTDAPSATLGQRTDLWERVDVPAPTVTAGGGDNGGPEPFGRGGGVSESPELSTDAGRRNE